VRPITFSYVTLSMRLKREISLSNSNQVFYTSNNSSVILQILDIGIREKDDIITYPDENVIYIKNKRKV
jgi:uncharacterized cupin superfamily protein